MNPRSGGGKVDRFGLRAKAEQLGADVVLLEGPEPVDVAALARARAAAGADLLGVAGGDGTQALVADVAAELGLPFLVIPAGTRNHFALDLGLDREDPSKALDALSDGVELRVDLGRAGGLPFVNNVSFGAYAEVVQSPAYRDGKTRTTLDLLPDLLARHKGAELTARVDEHEVTDPQALLVSNNPYGARDIAGLGRRTRLDGGILGCVGVRVTSAAQAAGLLRGSRSMRRDDADRRLGGRRRRPGFDPRRPRRRGGAHGRPRPYRGAPRRAAGDRAEAAPGNVPGTPAAGLARHHGPRADGTAALSGRALSA